MQKGPDKDIEQSSGNLLVSCMVAAIALVSGIAAAESFKEPAVGTIVVPEEKVIAYDRAKTGLINSIRAKPLNLDTNREYYIYETLTTKGFTGSETWIRMAPITDGKLKTSESAWIKWSDGDSTLTDAFKTYENTPISE